MSEQPKLRHLDATIREWLLDDAQQAATAYRGMDVPRGEAYDCALLCVGKQMHFYGCAETRANLEFVQQTVWNAVLHAYRDREQTA